MRLDELKGYKNKVDDFNQHATPNNIVEYLESKGLSLLGKPGRFGSVWDFGNPNWVLKVTRGDLGYPQWANLCMKHKDNPYLPRFKGKVIDFGPKFGYRGIIIERLEPLDYNQYSLFSTKINVLAFTEEKYRDFPPEQKVDKIISDQKIMDWIGYDSIFGRLSRYVPSQLIVLKKKLLDLVTDQHLMQLVDFIYFINSKNTESDMKFDNCMARGNQIVVTDPWYALDHNHIV